MAKVYIARGNPVDYTGFRRRAYEAGFSFGLKDSQDTNPFQGLWSYFSHSLLFFGPNYFQGYKDGMKINLREHPEIENEPWISKARQFGFIE